MKKEIGGKVIGEGTYGCVHDPSLHCETSPSANFNYDTYVSKLMKTEYAKKELEEFLVIGKIDPTNEYHLGNPIMCKPEINAKVKKEISECTNIQATDVIAHTNKYSLLIMKSGGFDLKQFCVKEMQNYFEHDRDKLDLFLLEILQLFKGLKFFKDNGLIHYDLKPQNILFDTKTGKLKFIDFGLMREKTKVIESSINNSNGLGSFHWSYPFDAGFMNEQYYTKYKNMNKTERKKLKNEIINLIEKGTGPNTYNLKIRHPRAFDTLFLYVTDMKPTKEIREMFVDYFFNGFDKLIDTEEYVEMLDKIVDSIDVFGLGFSLQFIMNCLQSHDIISEKDYKILFSFFSKMCDPDPSRRVIDLDILINDYKNVLLKIGVLSSLNKDLNNNNDTIDKKSVSSEVIKSKSHNTPSFSKIKSASLSKKNTSFSKIKSASPLKIKSASLSKKNTSFSKIKSASPLKIKSARNVKLKSHNVRRIIKSPKNCPENKVLNPTTKRCVKNCKEGYKRNDSFKCRKECVLPNEVNPNTGKCVKNCKEGYKRNESFKCRKECVLPNEVNPNTGKCVKNCKEGYKRNESFKCRKEFRSRTRRVI